jgi:hypothetical protein
MLMSADAQWSKNLFASLNEGGVWGVPRSGLMFRKRGKEFVLFARMPHMKEMPITARQLRRQQNSDFAIIREKFAEAGIKVRKEVVMTRFSNMELRDGCLVETEVREIKQNDMMRCPHHIMVARHYRDDGSCKCNDPNEKIMRKWGYRWKNGSWK